MLGLNFGSISLLKKPILLDKYIQALYEIDADTIRIPFFWKFLLKYELGNHTSKPVPNPQVIENYHKFYSLMPSHLRILCCIVQVPFEIAHDYFYDQSIMPERYQEYIGFLLDTFPFIDDIELWNEPNASDFYLSVAENSHHRPWRGEEFVRDILVPGSSLLKQRGFTGKVAGATFAEDGIVGHEVKPPALANVLAKNPKFQKMRSKDQKHGQFYFNPKFSHQVMSAIQEIKDNQNYNSLKLDALAIHPYPYFANKHKLKYWKHSQELTDSFLENKDKYGLSNLETWVTEVGCRSLDVLEDNLYSDKQQVNFLEKYPSSVGYNQKINRLYWYKFNDEDQDLRQEKLFGMFDHYGNKKQVFYRLKNLKKKCLDTDCSRLLVDDFTYGTIHHLGRVDPNFWLLSQSTPFGFATCAVDDNKKARLLIFPGRENRDWLQLKTVKSLAASNSSFLHAKLGINFYSPDTFFVVTIAVSNKNTSEHLFSVSLLNSENEKAKLQLINSQNDIINCVDAVELNTVTNLRSVNLTVEDCMVKLALTTTEQKLSEIELGLLSDVSICDPLNFKVQVTKVGGKRGFVELTDFWAYREPLNYTGHFSR